MANQTTEKLLAECDALLARPPFAVPAYKYHRLIQSLRTALSGQQVCEIPHLNDAEAVSTNPDNPLVNEPEGWAAKPFCNVEWYRDRGDPSVGLQSQCFLVLAQNQKGTVIADLIAGTKAQE